MRIEPAGGRVVFRAAEFTYRFDAANNQWEIVREKNNGQARSVTAYRHATTGTDFRFKGTFTDDAGILEILRSGDEKPFARLELWNRERLATLWFPVQRKENPRLTLDAFTKELETSEPEVAGVAEDGTHLWLAIRYYAGEGVLGIGTLVRLDPASGAAEILQPADLALSSLTHIVAANGMLWLGTQQEGEAGTVPADGLVRYNPATGEARSSSRSGPKILGHLVPALLAMPDALWVATDAGMCRIALPGETSKCWRIVPMVTLAAPLAVSNRPGGPPRGRLPAGSYEVRWANAGFFELVTPDAMEGWLEADDLEEYRRREFDQWPYELANTYGGGAGVMRLLEKPEGDPLAAAQAYRAALEAAGAPNEEGWQRVRARVGWIPRKESEVLPRIQPAAK